jgi:class 3 adenylate cyclase
MRCEEHYSRASNSHSCGWLDACCFYHLSQAKRSKGPPNAKPGDKVLISVVVTDVKDFSDLTRRYPEVMNKAMGGHNNRMRKACHAHAGHVLDQEGDSWTIAFHDAEDAVAFALQVGDMLLKRLVVLNLCMMRCGGGFMCGVACAILLFFVSV